MTDTADQTRDLALSVQGMDCASCVAHVEKAARSVPGVQSAAVNLARGRAVVTYDPSSARPEAITKAITESGYPAAPESSDGALVNVEEQRLQRQMRHARSWLYRAIAGMILWLPVEVLHWLNYRHAEHAEWLNWLALATSTLAIVYVGQAFYVSAFKALLRRTTNMDTLIAMGATVAYVYSLVAFVGHVQGVWQLPHLYFMESTGLLALISLGHYLEARSRQSAGSAIRQLLQLAPSIALKLPSSSLSPSPGTPGEGRGEGIDSQPIEVPVSELHPGDRVLVRPGDRIPIDGVVLSGASTLDESMLTGESLPVAKKEDDEVFAGTQNLDGRLIIRAAKTGPQTALAQIVQLVERAQSTKPPIQNLADRISAVFVPTVLVIAVCTAAAWYAIGSSNNWSPALTWATIANATCSVLIIACPCALGLALPAALMVGTGLGAKRGILIRDIDALQNASQISVVVLDKTGTLTQGKPAVFQILPADSISENELLRLAASAEQYSEHPLAKSIVSAARARNLRLSDPSTFTNDPGHGVAATIDNQTLLVGSRSLVEKQSEISETSGALCRPHGLEARVTSSGAVSRDTGFQPVHGASESEVLIASQSNGTIKHLGTITLADPLKPDSKHAIATLHQMNLKTLLLTGDNDQTARHIAAQVGIDDIRAQVKPDQKAAVIRELQQELTTDDVDASQSTMTLRRHPRVAMVGDGINDAPALAQADLGIALGSGSDIAKETGHIILVSGSLSGVPAAIKLSRATMRTIKQNLFFAFLYNVLAIPIAAGVLYPFFGEKGMLSPLIAAAAMALSDITVIGNALLLRRTKLD